MTLKSTSGSSCSTDLSTVTQVGLYYTNQVKTQLGVIGLVGLRLGGPVHSDGVTDQLLKLCLSASGKLGGSIVL